MDFLKEVGKLIEEETKKAQTSYESQQEILKQLSQQSTQAPATQRMPSQQAATQRTPSQRPPAQQATSQQAAAQRTPSQQSRHQVPRASAQPRKKEAAPQKERIQPVTATRRAAPGAVVPPAQREQIQDDMLKFTKKDIVKGIIMSELLNPPPCKRKKESG